MCSSDLSPRWVISRSLDGLCLILCPEPVWDATISERLEKVSTSKSNHLALGRLTHAGAFDVTCNSAGRLLIPSALLKAAGIVRQCTQIGFGNKVEIWSTERWKEYEERFEQNREQLTEGIEQFGL